MKDVFHKKKNKATVNMPSDRLKRCAGLHHTLNRWSSNANMDTALQHLNNSGHHLHHGSLLGLCLFGDILDGEALLADDGSHKLSRHEHAQGEVVLSGAWSTEAS